MNTKTPIMLALALSLPIAAQANCAREVKDMSPKVRQIKDDRTRARAQDYLQRATRELIENDEFECQTAIDAIRKLMPQK